MRRVTTCIWKQMNSSIYITKCHLPSKGRAREKKIIMTKLIVFRVLSVCVCSLFDDISKFILQIISINQYRLRQDRWMCLLNYNRDRLFSQLNSYLLKINDLISVDFQQVSSYLRYIFIFTTTHFHDINIKGLFLIQRNANKIFAFFFYLWYYQIVLDQLMTPTGIFHFSRLRMVSD
jgi:hypothetical protein